jgi:hypothetical protein
MFLFAPSMSYNIFSFGPHRTSASRGTNGKSRIRSGIRNKSTTLVVANSYFSYHTTFQHARPRNVLFAVYELQYFFYGPEAYLMHLTDRCRFLNCSARIGGRGVEDSV